MTDTTRKRRSEASGLRRRLLLHLAAITFAGPSAVMSLLATAEQVLAGPPRGFVLNDTPKSLADVQFSDGEGRPQTLSNFRGKVVLLNVWATWCLPCRTEMPTLDRLQATLGGDGFEVVALSIDRKGATAVKTFYSDIGVQHLAMHLDVSGQALSALAVIGLPATILIDSEGRELGRLMGPAEWDAPDMVAFLKSIIEQNGAPAAVPEYKEQPQ
ncbi:TlpA disulfide reductase family protein [Rhizobium lentis]|uniref:TlpA family protein disulfide reductase n=1 Tax=Rhizobium lentis TaxID=1138194 RepID=UPI00287F4643|nr:TlpA disulfide reductase family protein [Rhizobium lentis]